MPRVLIFAVVLFIAGGTTMAALAQTPGVEEQLKQIIGGLQSNLEQQRAAILALEAEKQALLHQQQSQPLSERSPVIVELEEQVEASALDLRRVVNELEGDTLRAQFEYQTFAAAHFEKVAAANLWAVYAILIISCLVVVAGVVFTGVQLWYVVQKGGPQQNTEMEASAQRFRLTTSFVGVTVLSLSLVFLYLFASAFYQPLPNDFVGRSTPPDQQTNGGAETVSTE